MLSRLVLQDKLKDHVDYEMMKREVVLVVVDLDWDYENCDQSGGSIAKLFVQLSYTTNKLALCHCAN